MFICIMTESKFFKKNDLVKVVGCPEIAPQTVCEFKNYYNNQTTCEVEPISNELFEKWYWEGLYINGKVFRRQRHSMAMSFEENIEYMFRKINLIVNTNQLRPVELQSNKRFILTEVLLL